MSSTDDTPETVDAWRIVVFPEFDADQTRTVVAP